MEDLNKMIQKKIQEIWPDAQETISKISKDAAKTLKKSEKQLKAAYEKTRQSAEQLVLKAKREELYYELGKSVAPLLMPVHLKNKKVRELHAQIKNLNKQLHSK